MNKYSSQKATITVINISRLKYSYIAISTRDITLLLWFYKVLTYVQNSVSTRSHALTLQAAALWGAKRVVRQKSFKRHR